MNQRLRDFLRHTREWVRAQRGLELFRMVARDLESFVEMDSGFFVYQKRLQPDGTIHPRPQEAHVYAAWGEFVGEEVELSEWVVEAVRRIDLIRQLSERWIRVDAVPWPVMQNLMRAKNVVEIGIWPLYSRERIIGALVLTRTKPRPPSLSDAEEISVLDACSAQVSVALDLILAIRSAEETSQRDWLTGLFNRRGLEANFPKLVRAAQLARDSVVFGLIDLNNLKVINDTLGHPAGDEELQQVAEILRNSVRDGDLVARLGGDEFAVVLRTNSTSAEAEMLRIQRIVHAHSGGHSVSIGGSVWGTEGETLDACYQIADERMYRDKRMYADKRIELEKQPADELLCDRLL